MIEIYFTDDCNPDLGQLQELHDELTRLQRINSYIKGWDLKR